MLHGARDRVAVVGTSYSNAHSKADAGLGALVIEAAQKAADNAGLDIRDIDGFASYHRPGESMPGQVDGVDFAGVHYLVRTLGQRNVRWFSSLDRGLIGAATVEAVNALYSGSANYVLVFRAMRNSLVEPRQRFSDEIAPFGSAVTSPYGLPALGASLAYSQYMALYGATREHMATFIVGNRANAAANPDAAFYQSPITIHDYLSARLVIDPLSALDCDIPVDAVSALILTTTERARDLRQPPVYVAGYATLGFDYFGNGVPTLEACMEAARIVASALWLNSGLGPRNVDQAHVYDSFSHFVYIWLEAFGFCEIGEAFQFIQGGRVAIGGELPVNTSGGSLGMGRLHGGAQLIEAIRQIQGVCGSRQDGDVNVALVTTGAPTDGVASLLFSKEPTT
jgi:acetyl-CoA acetyltransferase